MYIGVYSLGIARGTKARGVAGDVGGRIAHVQEDKRGCAWVAVAMQRARPYVRAYAIMAMMIAARQRASSDARALGIP
eukprot:SAG11_NODE_2116_length_3792_cov_5.166802_2_plen_78_part_00